MGGWNLDLTIISATNLPDVRNWSIMKVFAEVSVTGQPDFAWKTPVDYDGGINPKWNVKTPFEPEQAVRGKGDILRIQLYCERTFQDPKYVGEVNLWLKSLYENRLSQPKHREYTVSGANDEDTSGQLQISYRFDEIVSTSKATSPAAAGEGGGSEVWEEVVSSVVKFVAKGTAAVVLESLIPGSSIILEVWE